MGYLDPDELASIQADLAATFPDTIGVYRNTMDTDGIDGSDLPAGSDGAGGQVESWAIVNTYSGRVIDARPGDETQEGGRTVSWWRPMVLLPVGIDIRVMDRLQQNGAAMFEVSATDSGKTEAFCLTVYARKLTG